MLLKSRLAFRQTISKKKRTKAGRRKQTFDAEKTQLRLLNQRMGWTWDDGQPTFYCRVGCNYHCAKLDYIYKHEKSCIEIQEKKVRLVLDRGGSWYLGVEPDPNSDKKWLVRVGDTTFGPFDTEEVAARAYDKRVIELNPDADTNFLWPPGTESWCAETGPTNEDAVLSKLVEDLIFSAVIMGNGGPVPKCVRRAPCADFLQQRPKAGWDGDPTEIRDGAPCPVPGKPGTRWFERPEIREMTSVDSETGNVVSPNVLYREHMRFSERHNRVGHMNEKVSKLSSHGSHALSWETPVLLEGALAFTNPSSFASLFGVAMEDAVDKINSNPTLKYGWGQDAGSLR